MDPGTELVGQSVAVPLAGRRVASLRYRSQTRSSLSRSLCSGFERLPVVPSAVAEEGTGRDVAPFGGAVVEFVPFRMELALQLRVGLRLVVLQRLDWKQREDVS